MLDTAAQESPDDPGTAAAELGTRAPAVASDPWEDLVERTPIADIDGIRTYHNVRDDLRPDSEVAQTYAKALLEQTMRHERDLSTLHELRSIMHPDDQAKLDQKIEEALEHTVRSLVHARDFVPPCALLSKFFFREYYPRTEVVADNVSSLMSSAVEIWRLYKAAEKLGFELEDTEIEHRLKMARGLECLFHVELPHDALAEAIEQDDHLLMRRVSEVFNYAPGERLYGAALVVDEEASLRARERKKSLTPIEEMTIEDVLTGLAEQQDIDGLSQLHRLVPTEQFKLGSEHTDQLFYSVCARKDFGSRNEASSTTEFLKLCWFAKPPSDLEQRGHFHDARMNYFDPLEEGLKRSPLFESVIGYESARSDEDFRLDRFLSSAELSHTKESGKELALDFSQALSVHFERVQTPRQLEELLNEVDEILVSLSGELRISSEELFATADRIGLDKQVVRDWYFGDVNHYSQESTTRHYFNALRFSYDSREFGEWCRDIQASCADPFSLEKITTFISHETPHEAADYIKGRLFEMGIATLAGQDADRVEQVLEMEKLLEAPFDIPQGYEQAIFTRILSPRLREGDSLDVRQARWDGAEAAFNLVAERSGAAPDNIVIQKSFSFLFACCKLRYDDMSRFKEISGGEIEEESVRDSYGMLAWRYCTTDSPQDETKSILDLERLTGVPFNPSEEHIKNYCRLALISIDDSSARIAKFIERAGYEPDQGFIKEFILDNPAFWASIHAQPTEEMLEQHFADERARSLPEYCRLAAVFGCFDFYKKRLGELEGKTDKDSLEEVIAISTAICLVSDPASKRFKTALELIWNAAECPDQKDEPPILARAIGMLLGAGKIEPADLAAKEETHDGLLLKIFFTHPNPFIVDMFWRRLFHQASFEHKCEDHSRCKEGPNMLLKILLPNGERYFELESRQKLLKFQEKSDFFEPADFQYAAPLLEIPSREQTVRSQRILARALIDSSESEISYTDLHRSYPNIPMNAFVQLATLLDCDETSLKLFDEIYSRNRSTSVRSELLFAIISAGELPPEVKMEFTDLFSRQKSLPDNCASMTTQVLTYLSFSAAFDSESAEEDLLILAVSPDLSTAMDELRKSAERRLFGFIGKEHGLDSDHLKALWETSDNFTPLFVYIAKLAQADEKELVGFIAEMLDHIDPPNFESWKKWRYDLSNPTVAKQIGWIDNTLLENWTNDKLVPVGDFNLSFDPGQKGRRVLELLFEAFSGKTQSAPEADADIISMIGPAFLEASEKSPQAQEQLFHDRRDSLVQSMQAKVVFANAARLPALDRVCSELNGFEVFPINTKTLGLLRAVSNFLPDQDASLTFKRFNELRAKGQSSALLAELFDDHQVEILRRERDSLRSAFEQNKAEGNYAHYYEDHSGVSGLKLCYQEIRSLSFASQICQLAADASMLAGTDESQPELQQIAAQKITKMLGNIRSRSHAAPFSEQLENAQTCMGLDVDFGTRQVALLFTDNPEILLQIGKYPLGCGSCKNLETGVGNNVAVASDMADSHIKAAYMLDLSRLPREVTQLLSEGRSDLALDRLNSQDVFRASIARSIFKMVQTSEGQPGLFVEDVYTPLVDSRAVLAEQFESFAISHLAEKLGACVLKEGRELRVKVPGSKSPAGQYEDRHATRTTRIGIKRGAYQMRAMSLTRSAETARPVASSVEAGKTQQERLGRGRYLERRFDLSTLLFDGQPDSGDLSRALEQRSQDMVAVRGYSSSTREDLLSRGFIEVPRQIGYTMALPTDVESHPSFEEAYLSSFSSKSRSTRRREFRKLQGAVDSGELTISFDRGQHATDMAQFVELYKHEMGQKDRGWVPLVHAIEEEGGSLTQFLRMSRLGVFLKHEDKVVAGIVASRLPNGYSIGYQCSDSDLRQKFPQMSRFLVLQLLKHSHAQRLDRAYFGVDTNLYGHHLGTGLLYSKVKQGFSALPLSSNGGRLVKITNPDRFDSPSFMYSVGTGGQLEGNVFFKEKPTPQQLSVFKGVTPKLNVWLWEEDEFKLSPEVAGESTDREADS